MTTSGEDRAKQGEALPRIDRCPFCGGEAEWHDDEAVIQCARCLSRSGVRRNQAYGTRLWNQRAAEIHAHVNMDDDAPPEVREALHALIVHTHDQMSRESRAATRAGEAEIPERLMPLYMNDVNVAAPMNAYRAGARSLTDALIDAIEHLAAMRDRCMEAMKTRASFPYMMPGDPNPTLMDRMEQPSAAGDDAAVVERVARAIYDEQTRSDTNRVPWESVPGRHFIYRLMAKAAIAAAKVA